MSDDWVKAEAARQIEAGAMRGVYRIEEFAESCLRAGLRKACELIDETDDLDAVYDRLTGLAWTAPGVEPQP